MKPNNIDFNFYKARKLGSRTYSFLGEAKSKLPRAVVKSDLSSAEDNHCDARQKTVKHYNISNCSLSQNTNKLKKTNLNLNRPTLKTCPPRYLSEDVKHVFKESNLYNVLSDDDLTCNIAKSSIEHDEGLDYKNKSMIENIFTTIKVLTSQAYMKYELQAMMYLCQTTNDNIEKLLKEKSSFIPVQNDVDMEMFPIKDEDELQTLEEKIKDSSFRSSLVHKVASLIGNKDLGNSVRRIMMRMFDDKFLSNYS